MIFGVLDGFATDPDNVTDGYSFQFAPGNINAIVTAVLVLVRVITTSWSSTVAWRSAFLLMEKGEIDLRQLNTMVSWGLFQPVKMIEWINVTRRNIFKKAPIRKAKPKTTKADGTYGFYVSVIMLAMWPATFSAPLLPSSIEWLQSPDYSDVRDEALFFDKQGTGMNLSRIRWNMFTGHNGDTGNIRYQKESSNSIANMFADYTTGFIVSRLADKSLEYIGERTSRYVQPKLDHCVHTEINSTRYLDVTRPDKITVPCIKTGTIQWTQNDTIINATRDRVYLMDWAREWLRAAEIGGMQLIHPKLSTGRLINRKNSQYALLLTKSRSASVAVV
jgi:hypothetical protein